MSVKIMGEIWGLDLPSNQLLILLALADHADHKGGNAYPAIDTLAWKTGYSPSTVRRCLKLLSKRGILTREDRIGKTTIYTIHPEKATLKPDPCQNDTPVIVMTPPPCHSYDTPPLS